MKTKSELKLMSVDELKLFLLELRKNQFSLRIKRANGDFKQTHLFKVCGKSIACLKTLITQKLGENND